MVNLGRSPSCGFRASVTVSLPEEWCEASFKGFGLRMHAPVDTSGFSRRTRRRRRGLQRASFPPKQQRHPLGDGVVQKSGEIPEQAVPGPRTPVQGNGTSAASRYIALAPPLQLILFFLLIPHTHFHFKAPFRALFACAPPLISRALDCCLCACVSDGWVFRS